MRALPWIAAVLALLWTALWGVAHLGMDRLDQSLAARGVIVTQDSRRLTAWPVTLRARWQAPQAAAPRALWQADWLTVAAPLSRPGWIETDLGGHQRLSLPGGTATLDTDQLSAALQVHPLPPLPVRAARADVAAGHLAVAGMPLGSVAGARARISLDPQTATADIALTITGLQPLLTQASPEITAMTLDARADLDRPATITGEPARLARLTITALTIDWNGAALALSGTLSVSPKGLWEGQLTLSGTHWEKALEAAVAAGLMEPGIAKTWSGLARTLGATDDRLNLPLKVSGGQVWLGLLPVATLPAMPPPRP